MAQPNVLRQIRRFCMQCQGNSSAEVRNCKDDACILWLWREAYTQNEQDSLLEQSDNKQRLALRQVRRHCLTCAEHRTDVRACTAKEDCPLWSLRFGVYPTTYRRVKERCTRPKMLNLFNY